MSEPLLGAIEAGGTKFMCALGTGCGDIVAEKRIETGAPEETIAKVVEFLASPGVPPLAIGIASFGPVQLDRSAANYGFITSTPKRDWREFDMVGAIRSRFEVPIGLDTDVNAAALAEHQWGAAQGLKTFLYVTVGTGIGGGAMVEGSILHGRSHPEMGHIRIPHDHTFPGVCPYHGDCLEGLASGVAIEARWGAPASSLPDDHPAWTLEADYLALACANWTATLSPEAIVFGGGVMRTGLFPRIRERVRILLAGYLAEPEIVPSSVNKSIHALLDESIGGPKTDRAGVLGALVLAQAALNSASKKASTSPSISPDSRA